MDSWLLAELMEKLQTNMLQEKSVVQTGNPDGDFISGLWLPTSLPDFSQSKGQSSTLKFPEFLNWEGAWLMGFPAKITRAFLKRIWWENWSTLPHKEGSGDIFKSFPEFLVIISDVVASKAWQQITYQSKWSHFWKSLLARAAIVSRLILTRCTWIAQIIGAGANIWKIKMKTEKETEMIEWVKRWS